jgi:hypothetical protein
MINLDKNDDFVYSTKNVYLYFAAGRAPTVKPSILRCHSMKITT